MKLTVKDERGEAVVGKKLRACFDLLRPATLVAPMVGVLLAALAGVAATGGWERFNLFTALYAAVTVAILNGASNSLNQVTDIGQDKINKPYRPIPSRRLTKREAILISAILYIVAITRAIWVSTEFSIIVLILAALTTSYSLRPIRIKDRLWLNNISIAAARGGLGLMVGWSVFTPLANPLLLSTALVVTLFFVGMTVCKDLNDVKGDMLYGTRTIPVEFGVPTAIRLLLPFGLAAALLSAWFVVAGVLNRWGILLAAIYISSVALINVVYARAGTKESKIYENSWPWLIMYVTLGLSHVVFLAMALTGT